MHRSQNSEKRRRLRLTDLSASSSHISSATSDVLVSEKSTSGRARREIPAVRGRPCRKSHSDTNSVRSAGPSTKTPGLPATNHFLIVVLIPALEKLIQDDHGFLFIDADEAVHSLYVFISKLIELCKSGSPQTLIDDVVEDAALLAQSPATYLAHDVAPASAVDFGMTVGSSLLVCFFAVLAIKAGAHEIKEAAALKKVLKIQRAAIRKALDQIQDGQHSVSSRLLEDLKDKVTDRKLLKKVDALLKIVNQQALGMEQRLSRIEDALEITHLDLRIGQASAFSGSIILTKALAETANAVISAAATGQVDVAHLILSTGSIAGWITPAATAVGAMSTFALGPAAGIGAVALGSYFVHKSRLTHNRLKNETAQWRHDLYCLRSDTSLSDAAEDYLRFTDMKLAQREKFALSFLRWNSLFLVGSTTYCASTLAKTALTVSAVAGAVAAANPVALGVILGILLLAGIGMTLGSQQFLHMHDKQKRYDKYRYLDDMRIDRHRLAAVDLCHPAGMAAGLALRSDAYSMLRELDQSRQGLLAAASHGMRQHYRPLSHTADKQPEMPLNSFTLSRKNTAGKWIRGRLTADRTFFSGILQGDAMKAARAARKAAWAAKRPNLNKRSLDAWCQRSENFDALKEFMGKSLMHQNTFLSRKLEILAETKGHPLMRDSKVGLGNDEARFKAGTRLFEKIQGGGDISAKRLRRYKREFFRLQGQSESAGAQNGDHPHDADAHFDKCFASWLLKEEYCDLRGILLETELEASVLRRKERVSEARGTLEKWTMAGQWNECDDESSSLVESSRRAEESSDMLVSETEDVCLERITPRVSRPSERRRGADESSDVLVSRTEDLRSERRTARTHRSSQPVLAKRRSIESQSVSDSSFRLVSRRQSAPPAYRNDSGRGQIT